MPSQFFTPQIIVLPPQGSAVMHLQTWLQHHQQPAIARAAAFAEILNADGAGLTVEQVRQTIAELAYHADAQRVRIMVMLQLEAASVVAQQALLKTLEEPPAQTVLIITTYQPERLLPTIVSRCEVVKISAAELSPVDATGIKLADQNASSRKSLDSSDEGTEEAEAAEAANQLSALPITELVEQLKNKSAGALITLAERYQDRQAAIAVTQALLTYFHQLPPSQLTTQALTQLLHTHTYLHQNANVRLAIEQAFFRLNTLFVNQ